MPAEISIAADGFESQSKSVGEALATSRWRLYLIGATHALSLALGDIELSPGRQQETSQPVIQLREAAGSQAVRLDPLLRLNAADFVSPPPWWQRLVWHNILLSLLPILSWLVLMIRRRLRRPVLQRLTNQTPPTLHEVVLQGGTAALLPSVPLRRFAQSLRRRRFVHSAVLDETKTIESTMHRGGLFFPVFGSRVEPQYLVLIDRTSVADHQAQLALQIVTDLVRTDVLIDYYEFDGDPSLLRYVESGRVRQRGSNAALVTARALQVNTLEEVLARSPTHRLLLFCAPTLLFDGLTGQSCTWVEQLVSLEERFLFTPEPPERWGRAEWLLEKSGFSIVPLSRTGFLILTETFQSGMSSRPQRPENTVTTQFVYKRTVGRWLERRAPKDDVVNRLCDDLERTLGPQEFLWLVACAVYPEVHWGLTLRLGAGLFANSRDIERLLPLLAPLVWLREAFMPDWLRQALLQRLTVADADRVRQVLMDILSSVGTATDTSFSLQIAPDSRSDIQLSWWERLRNWWAKRKRTARLIREAPQGSPLQDYVFVRFLAGKRLTALTPTAPSAFLHALFPHGYSWLGWRPWLSFTACLLLSSALTSPFSPIERLDSNSFAFHATSFSPDGKALASAVGKFVVLTDTATGKEVARMTHDNIVYAVAISPDGRYIVSGSADTIRVWDLTSGKEVTRMTHDDFEVTAVAVSPDNRYVVSGSWDSTARVWDLTSGKEIARMSHDLSVYAVAVTSDNRYVVSGSTDHTVRVWELTSGKEISRMTHDDRVRTVTVSPDSHYIVSGSWDSTARVWELTSSKEISRMTHDDRVTAVAVSLDNRYVVSGSRDKTARVWELPSGKEVMRLTLDSPVHVVAFSPDGQTLASMSRESLQLYRFTSSTSPSRAVAFLVGNNTVGTGTALAGPIPDVRAVGPALESLGFQVFTFENASQQQIHQAFADLKQQLRPDDRLLVFLSGFGAPRLTRVGEQFTFVTEITGKDANAPLRTEGINGTEIAAFFRDIPVTQALLVVDASSAQLLASMQEQYGVQQKEAKTRYLLTSYTEDHPMDSPKGSPFALAFAAALREMKQNTSGKELFNEITQRMAKTGDKQRPSYEPFLAGGHVSGDFQFVVPALRRQQRPSSNIPREQRQMAQ